MYYCSCQTHFITSYYEQNCSIQCPCSTSLRSCYSLCTRETTWVPFASLMDGAPQVHVSNANDCRPPGVCVRMRIYVDACVVGEGKEGTLSVRMLLYGCTTTSLASSF